MDDLGANNRNGTTEPGPHELLRGRAGVGARAHAVPRSRPHGLPGARRSTRRCSSASAAWCRTRSARARTSRTAACSTRIVERMYPGRRIPTAGRRSAAWRTSTPPASQDVKDWYASVLRPEQLRALAGRRHHAGAGAGAREEVLRRHSAGPPVDRLERWVPRLDANMRDQMQDRVPQARIYRVVSRAGRGATRTCSVSSCLPAC